MDVLLPVRRGDTVAQLCLRRVAELLLRLGLELPTRRRTLADLKQRGLLEDTLVIWGGEFGRTPVAQVSGKTWGRDHHPHGFTMWLAGGGMTPGLAYGATDEFGYHTVEKPVHVHVHDLHATILHQMGIHHERLTFRTQGRDFRLTDVQGKVVKQILT